ncbi:MAG: hypothetical protein WD716_05305 [Fimbriimonadaceae bacterium]
MLQAWYRYADRVGRYEAGPKDAPRVAVMVAVFYTLVCLAIAWPLLVERSGVNLYFWLAIPIAALVVATILGFMVERFRPRGHKDPTHTRTIIALVIVAWIVVCVLLELSATSTFVPLWVLVAADPLAHITKVLRSAKRDAATTVV